MSRGFGSVQRALLEAVEDTWTDLRPELWLCVAAVDLGLGEHRESRRRAAHGLARAGAIEVCTARPHAGWGQRPMLFARLPMGDASRDYADELRAEYREHTRAQWEAELNSLEQVRHRRWVQWYREPARRPHIYDLDDTW